MGSGEAVPGSCAIRQPREEYPHSVVTRDDDPNALPYSPSDDAHSTLWLDEDGDPAVYGMHVYRGNIEMRASDDPLDS